MEDEQGYLLESTNMSVSFTDEENDAITKINMSALKGALSPVQFSALSKLISCISACQYMAQGGQQQ